MVLVAIGIVVGVVDLGLGAAWVFHDLTGERERLWFSPTWSLLHVWFAFQAALLLVVLCVLPLAFLSGGKMSVPMIVGATVMQNAVFVAVASIIIFVVYRASGRAVGLTWLPSWRHLGIGLGLGILLCALGNGIEFGADRLLKALLSPGQMKWLDEASKAVSPGNFLPKKDVLASTGTFLSVLFAIGVLTPFGEEFLFRALLHRAARFRLGAFWGTALSGFVFAVAHAGPLQVIAILPMGIALGMAYDRTRSLWVPILMHAVNNTVSVTAMYYIPGMS
jgi:membrane protease YdiL (CAAX protease family)